MQPRNSPSTLRDHSAHDKVIYFSFKLSFSEAYNPYIFVYKLGIYSRFCKDLSQEHYFPEIMSQYKALANGKCDGFHNDH